jgi:hypothetical protein
MIINLSRDCLPPPPKTYLVGGFKKLKIIFWKRDKRGIYSNAN